MNQGIRHNEGKPQWSQIDFKSLEPMVRVLEAGEKIVGKSNWKKGLLILEVCESLLRHTFAYMDGEDNDQKSGQPHVGHIMANAMFLSHMHLFRPDMDNREKKEGPNILDQQIEEANQRVQEFNEKIVAGAKAAEYQNAKVGAQYPKRSGCTCEGKICGVQSNGEVHYCNHNDSAAHIEMLQRAYREKHLQ